MADFDPKRYIKNIEERIVHSDRLGDIKYTPLNALEVMRLNETIKQDESNDSFALKLAYAMFHKSYKDVSFEDFENMGLDGAEIARLILSDNLDFRENSSENFSETIQS